MKAIRNILVIAVVVIGAYWLYTEFLMKTDTGETVAAPGGAADRLAELDQACDMGDSGDSGGRLAGQWTGWADVDFDAGTYRVSYLDASGAVTAQRNGGHFVAAYKGESGKDQDGVLVFKRCGGGDVIVGHDYRKADEGFGFGAPFRLEKTDS